ncbi:MAG: hypothetical protein ACK4MQ_04390 [Hyphomonas sp.]
MKTVMISLLMAAAAASAAHAETCADAENAVRVSAAQGHALVTQMDDIRNQHSTTQWSIAMEQKALDDYGWDPETEDYIDELQDALAVLERRWNALNDELIKIDPVVRVALQTYETACGAEANTPALLSELGLNPG